MTISTAMTMSIHKSAAAGAAAPAGDFRRLSSVSTRNVAQRRYATMSNATLFCGNPEPTRMRWCISDKCLMLVISPSFHCSNNHGTTPKRERDGRPSLFSTKEEALTTLMIRIRHSYSRPPPKERQTLMLRIRIVCLSTTRMTEHHHHTKKWVLMLIIWVFQRDLFFFKKKGEEHDLPRERGKTAIQGSTFFESKKRKEKKKKREQSATQRKEGPMLLVRIVLSLNDRYEETTPPPKGRERMKRTWRTLANFLASELWRNLASERWRTPSNSGDLWRTVANPGEPMSPHFLLSTRHKPNCKHKTPVSLE